jgi:hypothetical protein
MCCIHAGMRSVDMLSDTHRHAKLLRVDHHLQLVAVGDKVEGALEGEGHPRRRTGRQTAWHDLWGAMAGLSCGPDTRTKLAAARTSVSSERSQRQSKCGKMSERLRTRAIASASRRACTWWGWGRAERDCTACMATHRARACMFTMRPHYTPACATARAGLRAPGVP